MAKKQFLVDIDLKKNQLLNAKLQNLTAHPTVVVGTDTGFTYYNTVDDTVYSYTGVGVVWLDLGSDADTITKLKGTNGTLVSGDITIQGTGLVSTSQSNQVITIASTATDNVGTVTNVAALTIGTTGTDITSTVATGTVTPVITLNIPTASASNRGALSAANWSTFNNKTTNLGTVTSVSALTIGTSGTAPNSSIATGTTTPTITLNIPLASTTSVTAGLLSKADYDTFSAKTTNLGTVTSVSSADGNATIATATTTPVITIISAPKLTAGKTISITGDIAYTSPSFDGSGNVTAAGTLATVATAGTTGSSTAIPVITINAKGLTTSITTAAVVAPAGTLSGITLKSTVVNSSLTSVGTLTDLTVTGQVTIPLVPTAPTSAASKSYVDAVKQGLDIKGSVRVASTANITIASALINGSTIDGVEVSTGDRVLLKNQTLPAQNGIYVVVASGAASRSSDADVSAEVTSGMFTFVSEGTLHFDSGWVLATNDSITLGSTGLSFTQFSGAGQIDAGTGLTKDGNTINAIGTANRIVVNANSIDIGTNVVTLTGTQTLTNKSISGGQITSAVANATLAATVTTNANLTGEVTSVGNTATVPNATVIGKVLTGYSSGAGSISATDTILEAIQKLNANDATNANLTGHITSDGNATTLGTFSSANLLSALSTKTGTGNNVFSISPTLTGTPIAPTATTATDSNQIATTAFVKAQGYLLSAGAVDKYAATLITDGTTTSVSITAATHGLGTSGDYMVQLKEIATNQQVEAEIITVPTTGVVTVNFNVAPAVGTYRITIFG